MSRRQIRLAERVYASLLWLYPPTLRREYGADMRQAFHDTWRAETRRRDFRGAWRAWAIVARDLVDSLPREWAVEVQRGWPPKGLRIPDNWRIARQFDGGWRVESWSGANAPTQRGFRLTPEQRMRLMMRRARSLTMNEKFEKFTERARKTLAYAQEEARRFNHNYIGTEHILLGLLRDEESVAAKVLHSLDVDLLRVRNAVEFIIGRGDHMVLGDVGLTPRSKKVIELAVDEARRLNHHYVGTEHLLLGLVREGEGIAAGALESLGVTMASARNAVMLVLNVRASDVAPDNESVATQPTDTLAATTLTLLCRDVEATRAFYMDYLNAAPMPPLGSESSHFVEADVLLRMPRGGPVLALRAADPASDAAPQMGVGAVEIGFYTTDISGLWNDLSKRNLSSLTALTEQPNTPRLRSFTLTDPDGRVLRFRGVHRG